MSTENNEQDDDTRRIDGQELSDAAMKSMKEDGQDDPPVDPPASPPVEEFRSLLSTAIQHMSEIRQDGQGFVMCAFMRPVPDVGLDGPMPDELPPGADRIKVNMAAHIGGYMPGDPRAAVLACINTIFSSLRQMKALEGLTIGDVIKAIGPVGKPQGKIIQPGFGGQQMPPPGGRRMM